METRRKANPFVHLLLCAFVTIAGSYAAPTEAGQSLPFGEMISSGEVMLFGERWEGVQSFPAPLFEGTKVRTEKGIAALNFSNDVRIEVAEQSLLSLDRKDLFVLSKGSIQFRIPASSQMSFSTGGILVTKSRQDQCVVGSMVLRPEGALTVRALEGDLSVLNQDRLVLTRLASNEAITIRSALVNNPPKSVAALTTDVVKVTDPIEDVQPRSVGFTISTMSDGEKGVTPSPGSGGLFPGIRERVRKVLCP